MTQVPTNTHNKSPSHVPSTGGDQSQAAPKGFHRTLCLSLSEGKKDFGLETTRLLSQLSLPNLNGSDDGKTQGRRGSVSCCRPTRGRQGRVWQSYAQALPTQAPSQVRGTHNQRSPREKPKTAVSRMGAQGEGCSEQPHLLPLLGAPRTQSSSRPLQPTAVPRGLPASDGSGRISKSMLHKQEGSCHQQRNI